MRRGVWEMMFSGAVANIPACSRLSSCITNKFQAFSLIMTSVPLISTCK
jgi:hypothetical protein